MTEIDQMNSVIRGVASTLRDAVVCDLGASNWGTVRQMLSWLPTKPRRFLAVEPDPRNLLYMQKHGIPEGVEMVASAIGREDGVGSLLLSESTEREAFGNMWSVSSSMRAPKKHLTAYPWVKFQRRVPVVVRSLDSLTREFLIPGFDFIWADIQGAERDMIEGGRETLARSRYMFIEAEIEEMYEGQWTREQMLAALPDWTVLGAWSTDVLLRNENVRP